MGDCVPEILKMENSSMQTKVKNEFAIAKHVGQAMLFMLLLLTGPASVVLASGPVILGTDPADGARDVPIGANIVVNFGGPMDLSTINGDLAAQLLKGRRGGLRCGGDDIARHGNSRLAE